jgi:hypothetical protein
MYASVKARKTRLDTLGTLSLQHVKLVFPRRMRGTALAFYLRLPPQADVKFLLGRSLHPEIFDKTQIHVPQCSPQVKILLEGTGIRKIC